MAKDKYEISLWDDIFVSANDDIPAHYEEEKIAVIGSDSMTTQCRAIEPKLVCNVNGKVTFTFKMYYRYHDELTGEDYDNPFLKLMINERKVKVYWLDVWYDLVIKNIQESSSGKTVIYTCEDANINELAKTGFNLIFDDNLSYNNIEGGNQGTVSQLVQRVIDGTDWQLGDTDIIRQYTEEAVFEVVASRGFTAYDLLEETTVAVAEGQTFLVYYPQLADFINNTSDTGTTWISPFYLAYDSAQQYNRLAKTEMVVQAKSCALGYGTTTCTCTINSGEITFSAAGSAFGSVSTTNISSKYRANKLVKEPLMEMEPTTQQYCYVYKAIEAGEGYSVGTTIYKTIETEFKDATYATNLAVNGSNFTTLNGWEYPDRAELSLDLYPVPQVTDGHVGESTSYLKLPTSSTDQTRYYYNDAFRANSHYFSSEGCKKGEKYVLRMKVKNRPNGDYRTAADIRLAPEVRKYAENDNLNCKWPIGMSSGGVRYFNVTGPVNGTDHWVEYTLTCSTDFTGSQIYSEPIGLFIVQAPIQDSSETYERAIEAIEFFKYIKDENDQRINPGQLNALGIVQSLYTYYKVLSSGPYYLYKDTVDWNNPQLEQQYNSDYSKIRSINIKQSNRFNILQTIAETFECWIRFNVPHSSTGNLEYETYWEGVSPNRVRRVRPKKYVTIKQEIGEERSIGFVYGIDLQSIQRTIESNSIVTKTIVLENNNEFGKNGTCRISRSHFNYPQIDFIYNFDYYINHNLLNSSELTLDLYTRTGTVTTDGPTNTRAFYRHLHDWNLEFESKAEQNASYSLALTKNEGLKTAYTNLIDAAREEIRTHKLGVCEMAGTKAYNLSTTKNFINNNIDSNQDLKNHVTIIESLTKTKDNYLVLLDNINTAITGYENKISTNSNRMDNLKKWIEKKIQLFEKKYARFISEGSWTDSKYYDDNLYYLDANSVAYTSSRPKVSYNISVIRVTGLEDFWMKDFSLGDISYIEDTEFFGYTYVQEGDRQIKTPYREKVIITEVTYNFDEPNKDGFKVQNYRTQFEDLFQRIAAQTQTLQYSTGAYNKAADIVRQDGVIKDDVLKASFDANSDVLDRTSVNNMVTTDDNGITVSNIQNASEAVRVTSGGLFITSDGGDTWKNAIRGDGIGTQYLTSGAIDTKKIQIYGEEGDGEGAVAFKWDADGINAYDKEGAASGYAYNSNRFVRFNNEGISIQTTTTSTGSTTYEKLKLGKLGTGQYGLLINSYVGGAVSSAFYATDSGNLYMSGEIKANGGDIGGWTINSTNLIKTTTINNTPYEVLLSSYVGDTPSSNLAIAVRSVVDGANQYVFRVNYDGSLTATKGNIAGWNIGQTLLSKVSTASISGASGTYYYRAIINSPASPSAGNTAFAVQHATSSAVTASWTNDFYVTYGGRLFAKNANIEGTIDAKAGTIGGLKIEEKLLHNGTDAASATASDSTALVISGGQEFTREINGTLREHLRMAFGSGFGVSTGGRLYASNAVIEGSITATSLTLTGGAKVAAADISGQLTAGQIDGKDLVITGSGKFGPFSIDVDGLYACIKAGNTIIRDGYLSTNQVKINNSLNLTGCQLQSGTTYLYPKWKAFSNLSSSDVVLVGSSTA